MRSDSSSTIGTERLTNYALQINTKEEFVEQMTANLPARPAYFLEDAAINREGAPSLTELPELKAIAPEELRSILENGGLALDVRSADLFGAGHVPGSVNIGLSGQFASWAGIVLGTSAHPVLIADTSEQVQEARLRLARVGIENVMGYLADGVQGWQRAGYPVQQVEQITAQDLHDRLQREKLNVLDVRREGEWEAAHIPAAHLHSLDRFSAALPAIDKNRSVAVHCKSGYRSMIACSLLQRAGYSKVINVEGGFDAWQKAELPEEIGNAAAIGVS
jgi:rhodanese-related sulfurtransferase